MKPVHETMCDFYNNSISFISSCNNNINAIVLKCLYIITNVFNQLYNKAFTTEFAISLCIWIEQTLTANCKHILHCWAYLLN